MKRKKIEFNLVGAIFIGILFLGTIICAIKFVPKMLKGKDAGNIALGSGEDNTVDEEIEMLEVVNINGTDELIMMKNCKGSFNYVMKYDPNKFWIEKNIDGKDKYNSLISDTIAVTVGYTEDNFNVLKEELVAKYDNNLDRKSGIVEEISINGLNGLKEIIEIENSLYVNYYFSKDNKCYCITEVCGLDFEEMVNPVIEKMVSSFQIF